MHKSGQVVNEGYRLSPQQRRLWQIQNGGSAYRAQSVVSVRGPLERGKLMRALGQVAQRHEILRTTFFTRPGLKLPIQVVHQQLPARWREVDLRTCALPQRARELLRIRETEGIASLDLEKGPILLSCLVSLARDEHALILTLPSLCADGGTLDALVRELSELYADGDRLPRRDDVVQYSEFSEWQLQLLEEHDESEGIWPDRSLDLSNRSPLASGSTPTVRFSPGSFPLEVPPDFVRSIRSAAGEVGVSVEAFLLSCWQVLLTRLSDLPELTVGVVVRGRRHQELRGSFGLFDKVVPLAFGLDGNAAFAELARKSQERLDSAQEQQEYFAWAAAASVAPGGEAPYFAVGFEFEERQPLLRTGELTLEVEESRSSFERFDLKLSGVRLGNGSLVLEFQYDAGRNTAQGVDLLSRRFLAMLKSASREWRVPAVELDILSDEEREFLGELNRTERRPVAAECVHTLFREQAARTPDAVAVEDERQCVSFRTLDQRANGLAGLLRELGVAPEALAGIFIGRSVEFVLALLAVLKAGGAYVPLEPSQPRERLALRLRLAKPRVIVTLGHLSGELPDDAVGIPILDLNSERMASSREERGEPASGVEPANAAYVLFTSGSTGTPKGVVVEHRQLVNYIRAVADRLELPAGARYGFVSTVAADLGNTALFPALCLGGSLELLSEERASDPEMLVRFLAERPLDCLKIVPSHLAALRALMDPRKLTPRMRLIVGGEAAEPALLAEAQSANPGCWIFNHYGPTEATVGTTTHRVQSFELDGGARNWIPLGRPLANAEVHLLDRRFQPVPFGVAGELYIGGAGVVRGYLEGPGITAERFVPDPFSGRMGARLYRTGDLCRFDLDGCLEFLGRIDHQVNVHGYRVELGEIEHALIAHPGVRRAVVLARGKHRGGRLSAYFVPEGGTAPSVEDLRSFLETRIPHYMLPSELVKVDSIPLTANGKVDRAALSAISATSLEQSLAFVAPQSTLEEQIARIWSDVLGIERVGRYDNFFELGGDSILCIQVVARALRFELRLTPQQIFRFPTVAQLAEVVAARHPLPGEQGPVKGPVPLTPIQRWFLAKKFRAPHHWNMSLMLELREAMAPRHLRDAIEQLLTHHDVLRSRLRQDTDGWHQTILGPEETETTAFSEIDLTAVDRKLAPRLVESAAEALQASLDLEQGPVLRAALFRADESAGQLLIVVHHLVVDGISWRVLLEDLLAAQHQSREDIPVRSVPKTTSFKRWAERLAEYADSAATGDEAAYWLEIVEGNDFRLPADGDEGRLDEGSAETLTVALSVEETRALLQELPAIQRTQINEVLLTALTQCICAWTGGRDFTLELEGHGREELFEDVDLSRTVGWFTTRFPVRLRLNHSTASHLALKQVKEQLRRVPKNGLGYGVLRYLSKDEALRARLSQITPEVSFNYLGQLDQVLPSFSPVTLSTLSRGPDRAPSSERTHLLSIVGAVIQGRLQFSWSFSPSRHGRETVDRLARSHAELLRGLIRDCRDADRVALTPSDFPLIRLDSGTLDELARRYPSIQDLYPLTPVQSGILFHSTYAPGADPYFERVSCTLSGGLDIPAFRRAWQEALDRHSVLRTGFVWEGVDEPLQIVHRHLQVPFVEHDWRGLGEGEERSRLDELMKADRERGFSASDPPLMRLTLVRLAEDNWRFIWSHHHLQLDGWSLSLLLREVMLTYQGLAAGQAVPLESSRPFRDYVQWIREQDVESLERYWKQLLRGFDTPTPLVISRSDSRRRYEGKDVDRQQIWLTTEITASLEDLARRSHLTLNTVIQGAWALLLSRYSGEDDVVFGVTVSGRSAPLAGIESMMGIFINSLPARLSVPPSRSFSTWLSEVQAGQAEQRAHEHSPLLQVQGWSDVPSGTPLFESLMVFENYPIDRSLGRHQGVILTVSDLRVDETTNYPLTLLVFPGPTLSFRALYDPGSLERSSVSRLLQHLASLLEEMVKSPDRRLRDFSLLTAGERQQLLSEWIRPSAPSRGKSVSELVERQAERTPDSVALVFEGQHLTYRQLDTGANRWARRLRGSGVGPDVPVGICLPRSLEMAVSVLAVLKAGGAYVPLDPSYPEERLAYMVEDSRAPLVLTTTELEASLPSRGVEVVCLDRQRVEEESGASLQALTAEDHLGYVIYTSGSTGRPKGIGLPHASLCNLIDWHRQTLRGGARTLQLASLSFDASFHELFATWITGGSVHLVPESLRRDMGGLSRFLVEHAVEKAIFPVVVLQRLAEEYRVCNELPTELAEWITTGEQLQITQPVVELFTRLPGATLHNHYGPSETHVVTAYRFEGDPKRWPSQAPIGRPIENSQVYVLDGELGANPIAIVGELYIGGHALARGYYGRPELTAERFVPHPFGIAHGERLYRTGDLARFLASGELEFLGRRDFQVKIRGHRVELGEIESVLAEHPAVRQAAVVVRTEGGGGARIVAHVVLETDADRASALREVLEHLNDRLPDYMVPWATEPLEALPLTVNGKVDRKALARLALADIPRRGEYVAPRDPVEEELARLWSALLSVERVGVNDDFFELGGHSLIAMQVISRVRERFQVELVARDLFDGATVAGLARAIHRGQKQTDLPPIAAVSRDRRLPLSFAQQRLWIVDQLLPGSAAYNIPAGVTLKGALDPAALMSAFQEILRRHEVLRTAFSTEAGQPVQVIAPALDLSIPVTDLAGLRRPVRDAELQRLLEAAAERPFDLTKAPLIRVSVIRLGSDEHALLLTMHHIVSDGWSMGILVREVSVLYDAFRLNRPVPLPPLPVQYADFAHWQRHWFRGAVLEEQLRYWKGQLDGTPALDLPSDRPRPAVQTFRGAKILLDLPGGLSLSLRELSGREGVTLFMTLLAAFQTLLFRYTAQSDVAVGTGIANRNRLEIENLIGFFVNMLVLRTSLSGDPSFRELMSRVREVCLAAYAHQDLPFEKLVEELRPVRDLSREPLLQVVLSLQNAPMPPMDVRGGLTLDLMRSESRTAKFDLTLVLWENGSGLSGSIEYNTDLFDSATMKRMSRHLGVLLEAVIRDPGRRLSDLPLLTSEERQQLLLEWVPARGSGDGACVHELFDAQAERRPDAIALVHDSFQLTYRELGNRSAQLASFLSSKGVRRGSLIGVCFERSVELVVALLGILKAGAAYVPLDPSYPEERIRFMLEDTGLNLLLSGGENALARAPANTTLFSLDRDWQLIEREGGTPSATHVGPDDLAYVMYTSGSTGVPRGVEVCHQGIVRLFYGSDYVHLDADQTILHLSSISFDASTFEVWAALVHGGRLVLFAERVPGPLELVTAVATHGVSLLWLTATFFNTVVDAFPALPNVAQLLIGGEALSPHHVAKASTLLPETQFVNGYGPTEATTFTCCYRIPRHSGKGITSIPIGRPIANTQVFVLDREMNAAPVGTQGELYVGGGGLARGYRGRAELTAEKFVPNPFGGEAGARLYRTGDLVRWLPEGDLEFTGRIDHQVKVRGFRIELGEIESVLGEHPDISQVVVLSRQERPQDRRLVAYYTLEPSVEGAEAPSGIDLSNYLAKRLPDYMVPSAYVELSQFPLTPSGKVSRTSLPPPEKTRAGLRQAYVAPRTPVEKELAQLWREVLGADLVGVHDNFFELGGDSILSIQVVARAYQRSLRVTPRQMFEHQTIAELAAVVETVAPIAADPMVVTGPVPLTPIQRWFFRQNLPDPQHFNQSMFVEIGEALDVRRLRRAVLGLLAHHDALRMRYERSESGWRQYIDPPKASDTRGVFASIDVSAIVEGEPVPAIEEAAAQVQASLNVGEGPLMRVVLFDVGGGPARLLFIVHHLVVDGVSWRILLQDLLSGYEQLTHGEEIATPTTTPFKKWAETLEAHAASHDVQSELSYWRGAGLDAEPLPLDHPGGLNDVASADAVTTWLTPKETEALLKEAPQVYRTQINDFLLAALVDAFRSWTASPWLLVSLEGHGREDLFEGVDLSRTVGWFTSMFPVRLDLTDVSEPGEILKRVKEQLRRVPNRGIGFGLLFYGGHRPPEEGNPVSPQVSFNYLGQFDQLLPAGVPLGLAPESSGPKQSPKGLRAHVLDVVGGVVGGRLRLAWTFSRNLHRRETIESLAAVYMDSMRRLIAHCQKPDAGGVTPADFPLAEVSQSVLDRLVGRAREVEDLYPLSPMQKGMLFHTLYAPDSAVYFEQLSCALVGSLRIAAFKGAWQRVVERHSILRTAFLWDGLAEPLQVVRTEVHLPWMELDWRDLDPGEAEQRLLSLLATDRERGFDLSSAPLMRYALIRISDDTWRFVWSFHHLLLDGWSVALVVKEVFSTYGALQLGRDLPPEDAVPFRKYIAWLRAQDVPRAQAFWQERLKGFAKPTLLAAGREPRKLSGEMDYAGRRLLLSPAATRELQSVAREQGLSLDTFVKGAWALILSHYLDTRDVVFGATSAGRPAALAGVESMVGLFINTLPIRVLVSMESSLVPWLKQLQMTSAETRDYEYTPLLQVAQWSPLPSGVPLFDTHQLFQNYPVGNSLDSGPVLPLRAFDFRSFTRANFPLSLVAALLGDELSLKILFDAQLFKPSLIDRMLEQLKAVLTRAAEQADCKLRTLDEMLTNMGRQFRIADENELAVTRRRLLSRAKRKTIHPKDAEQGETE